MSPRPHNLLFRLRAGFTSLPQQSRTGLHSRQTRPLRARCLTGYATQPIITGPNEALDDLRNISEPPDSATESPVSPSATPGDHVAASFAKSPFEADNGNTELTAARKEPRYSTIPSPHGPNPKVLHQQVGRVDYVYTLKNGQKRLTRRNISKETLAAERSIRSRMLYYEDRTAPLRWMAARDEIGEALAFGRKPQRHLANMDLRKEDGPLLDKLKAGSEGGFLEAWQALSKTEKADHWYHLSLWLLYQAPSLVPEFLLATCKSSKETPPMLMVSKCITHLNRFSPQLVNSSLISACLHPDTWPILRTPQSAVRLYINTADRDNVYHAWKVTRKKRTHVSPATVLCYMKRFVEFRDVDSALEALQVVQNLKHPDFSVNSDEVIRHCCKLLMLDTVADVGNGRNFCILPKLIELGVQPTRDMMNIVLSNALKGGDSQVGDVVLDYMRNNQLEADSYTYMALLTDAVTKGDRERLGSLLKDIQSQEELHKNKWISSKVLHSHFALTAKRININDEPNEVFYSMLSMYNQLHDITALKDLSIVPPHYTPPPGSGTSEPSVVALYIMIATYLRCLKNIAVAERLYSRYRNHVLRGHTAIAPLAATDHVYNEFLVAFRDDARGLQPAVRLVEDMQHTAGQKLKDTGLKQAPPSVRTWTMLLSAFVYHRQNHAAERVLAMMDKHKVEYSMDTWNMLINYHANSQNHLALAETIKKMESEGFTMDQYSMRSLRYLRDPERLWVAIDELDLASNPSSESSSSESEKGKETASLLDQGLTRLKDNMSKK
ncbi:hypothetical protein BJX63DRAFT_438176 [Aspergillus granulosus]|uniref:Pentatricopeptide repeat protein n=1 Tax=Aspergillus granulosus TaxID=176169 RepID=A0ABR4GST1_9EURO